MRFKTPFVVALCAIGCSDDPQSADPTTPIITVDENDPGIDSDGDGLSDLLEETGWTVYVDETGAPDVNGITTLQVTSNPNRADTDGDGLSDADERINGADPTRADTDRDGLFDVDEVLRWRTSPVSVDSDGDSRGQDANPATAPDPRLFDGAELALVPSEELGGLMIPSNSATSPLDVDSDGDGVWDFEEVSSSTRSPVRAEMPELRINQSDQSNLGIFLDVVESNSEEVADTFSVETGFGAGTDQSFHGSASLTMAFWSSLMMELALNLNVGVDLDSLGANVGATSRTEARFGSSVSTALTMGTNSEFRANASQTLEEVAELELTTERTISGGEIVAELSLENIGVIPFSAVNPSINMAYVDDGGVMRPLTVLEPVNPEDMYTLAVGESLSLVLSDADVPADRLLQLLAHPERLIFSPATLEILNAGDEEYAFFEEEVNYRAATLNVDFGNGEQQRHRIAAHVAMDGDGEPLGINVSDMLTVAEIEHDDGFEGNGAYRVEDFPTELHIGDATDLQADEGLDAPGYPVTGGPGLRAMREGWAAMIRDPLGEVHIETNLMTARAFPGDEVHFLRATDFDRDGVVGILEEMRGSSDDDIDSDDDGLSDFWEIREGWNVLVTGQPPLRVHSSPASEDADGDGLTDVEEFERGTHPLRADTDGDGVADPGDVEPTHYNEVRLTEIQTSLFDCSEQGCRNDWIDTPSYNLTALGWDITPGVTAVVLREVVPLGAIGAFEPQGLLFAEDLDDAVASGEVDRVYQGGGATAEDYDLFDNMRHIYHYYGMIEGIDGLTYVAYSGSEIIDFAPVPFSTEFYHVVDIAVDSLYMDEQPHGENHVFPWNLYHRHDIVVEYVGTGNNVVRERLPPVLQAFFTRAPNEPLPDVPIDPNSINDYQNGGPWVVEAPESPAFPVVTACLRNTGQLRITLRNFDHDNWRPNYEYPCNAVPQWSPTEEEAELMPDVPGVPPPFSRWGVGPLGCDDRQFGEKIFIFNDEEIGFDRSTVNVREPRFQPNVESFGLLGDEWFVYREDFATNRFDRDWYSDETVRFATITEQHVGLRYRGFLRDVDAEILCDIGVGVEPAAFNPFGN